MRALAGGRSIKTLGKWPDLSLKDARQAARELMASPPTITTAPTFQEARHAFLADCRIRLRPSTVERYHYALKGIENTKLDRIKTNIDDPNQIKALKAMFNWCIDRGMIDRNPFVRRKVRFAVRDRLLTDDEIAAIWNIEQPPFSAIVKLLILTGQRRNQIWRFQPGWVEGEELTFPADIMKSGRPHPRSRADRWFGRRRSGLRRGFVAQRPFGRGGPEHFGPASRRRRASSTTSHHPP